MHEIALCEGLVQALEEQAGSHGFRHVHRVWLEIGSLASVECDAIRFNFDIMTRGTIADNAKLDIMEVNGTAWCLPCGMAVDLHRFGDSCPNCDSHQLHVLDGTQIKIKKLEVT